MGLRAYAVVLLVRRECCLDERAVYSFPSPLIGRPGSLNVSFISSLGLNLVGDSMLSAILSDWIES